MRNELVIAEEKIYEVRWDCSEGLVVPVLDDLDIIPMSPIIFILPPLLLPLPDSEERFLRPRVAPEAPPNAKSAIKMGDLMLLVCAGKTVVSTVNCQLSTVNCQLSTVNCQLSTVNCQLSTVNCQLSTVNTATIHEFVRVLVRTEIGLSIFRSVNRVLYLVSTNFVRI
jgi:hypothetical protein